MHDTQKQRIVEAINTEMNATNASQNKWAAKHGIGRSSMTNIMNSNNWDKVGKTTWTKLHAMVQHILQKPKLYPTTNSKDIKKLCALAQTDHRVMAVTGYTGAGKTTALEQYASNHENAHYLVCRSTFGVKDLVIRIADVMGINAKSGRVIDIEQAIIDTLLNSPKSLLILDSVSKLRKAAALQFIGDLCEAIEHKAGIVLAGTEFFEDHMRKMVRRNKLGFREFNRRIYTWLHLKPFNNTKIQKEARAICEARGIYQQSQITNILSNSGCFASLSNNIDKQIKKNNT